MIRKTPLIAFFILAGLLSAQAGTTVSDAQAISLAAQAMNALTQGNVVSDVTLSGNATETAGATINTGTDTFRALGAANSRFDSGASSRTEIRTLDPSNHPVGEWIDSSSTAHTMAFQNCWADAAWFFPEFSALALANQSNVIAKYIGQETRNGESVQHLRFYKIADSGLSSVAQQVQQASQEDIYLDSTSLLPVALTFNLQPDSGSGRSVAFEIDFSDYQKVNGFEVPYHIQKLISGGVVLDFTVNQATLNSGLQPSVFNLQ